MYLRKVLIVSPDRALRHMLRSIVESIGIVEEEARRVLGLTEEQVETARASGHALADILDGALRRSR